MLTSRATPRTLPRPKAKTEDVCLSFASWGNQTVPANTINDIPTHPPTPLPWPPNVAPKDAPNNGSEDGHINFSNACLMLCEFGRGGARLADSRTKPLTAGQAGTVTAGSKDPGHYARDPNPGQPLQPAAAAAAAALLAGPVGSPAAAAGYPQLAASLPLADGSPRSGRKWPATDSGPSLEPANHAQAMNSR